MSILSGTRRVGWLVDLQADFLDPTGRLYVRDVYDASDPGAALIVPTLRAVADWMVATCDAVVYTADWHGDGDAEIDRVAPDPARGTYPPHCMGLSRDPIERAGAALVPEARAARNMLILERDATPDDAQAIARAAIGTGKPILLRKSECSAFTGNPAASALVDALRGDAGADVEFVTAGVAREVCVSLATIGLAERGCRVIALRDATWGLGLEQETVTLERWRAAGVHVATVAEICTDAGPPTRGGYVDQDAILIEIAELAREFARTSVHEEADADDIAQEVVLKCMTKLRTTTMRCADAKSLAALVRRMVQDRAFDQRRSDWRRAERDTEHLRDLTDSEHEWMSADGRVEAEALLRIREQALAGLPEICRRAYGMVREEGSSYKEAADRLGVAPSTVSWSVVEANRRFRVEFAANGIALPRRRKRAARARV